MSANDFPKPLSAKYPEQFANITIRERLPVILTQIADQVNRKKHTVREEYGEHGVEDVKAIAGCMSKLKNEVQTGKPIIPIEDNRTDTSTWNSYLVEFTEKTGEPPSWFISPWLYVECYMYRRVQEAVELTTSMKEFDVFCDQKRHAYTASVPSIVTLLSHLNELLSTIQKSDPSIQAFKQYMEVSLWGNKCDLSISAGAENFQKSSPIQQLPVLKPFILRDDCDGIWSTLASAQKEKPGSVRLDVILDNAGFELVTDLCLVDVLLSMGLVNTVHLHAKPIPWFVSDTTPNDFNWTLNQLCSSNNLEMSKFGQKWRKYLKEEICVFKVHDFWCLPFDYAEMKSRASDLYQDLGQADLIIFKGDLNYRKLVGDLNWKSTTPFDVALRGFNPAPLCVLRALKADVVVGLKDNQSEETVSQDPRWMINGNWAVICFSSLRLL